jgi:Protein of unknown function (DUF2934)
MPKTKTSTSAAKRVRAAAAPRRTRRRTAAVGHDQIAARAYEIHLSGAGGDPVEHWLRAERELAGE